VQQRYTKINSFTGNFIQKNYTNQNSAPREAKGTISFQRPGKMRWDYAKPNAQLLVTDGKTVWLYDPVLDNVTVQSLIKITDGTALSFLLGAGSLTEDFKTRPTGQTLITNKELIVLELVPKKAINTLDYLQLGVDAKTHDLKHMVLVDPQGNSRSIEFTDMKYNATLEAKLFNFEIKPGMEVIQQE
jgi:outer membrane lipoprotein carrier protein